MDLLNPASAPPPPPPPQPRHEESPPQAKAKEEEQQRILALFGAKRFVKGDAKAYVQIEEVGRQLGMIR